MQKLFCKEIKWFLTPGDDIECYQRQACSPIIMEQAEMKMKKEYGTH